MVYFQLTSQKQGYLTVSDGTLILYWNVYYRQVSNTRRTKSQPLNDSPTVLRLSLPNPLKPDVKSRMKM